VSTIPGSPSRSVPLLAALVLHLLAAAILAQPSSMIVLAMLPGEAMEAADAEKPGESESVENELASVPSGRRIRLVRRQQRRGIDPPGVVASSIAASWCRGSPRPPSGHRLKNGLTAPLRC
jgi:hypothetical protein